MNDVMEMLMEIRKEQREAKKSSEEERGEAAKNFESLNSKMNVVADLVEPLKSRLDTADFERNKLTEDVIDLRANIQEIRDDIKKIASNKQASTSQPVSSASVEGSSSRPVDSSRLLEGSFPPINMAANVSNIFSSSESSPRSRSKDDNTNKKASTPVWTESVMNRAGRTVSLFPILKEEVLAIEKELTSKKVSNNQKELRREALTMAVKEYLVLEMKISEEYFSRLDISNIFCGSSENWKTVYIELETSAQADWVLSHAGNLKKKYLTVGHHTPWQARARNEAFQSKAYSLRKESGMKTRIVIKEGDYVLMFREKDAMGEWEEWKGDQETPKLAAAGEQAARRITPTKAAGRKLRVELTGVKRALSPDITITLGRKKLKSTSANNTAQKETANRGDVNYAEEEDGIDEIENNTGRTADDESEDEGEDDVIDDTEVPAEKATVRSTRNNRSKK